MIGVASAWKTPFPFRGAPGELSVTVDARGFAVAEETVVEK